MTNPNTCPLCGDAVETRPGEPGRPRTYCSDGHRRLAEAERERLVAKMKQLDRLRLAALEKSVLTPHSDVRREVLAAYDDELEATRQELARLTSAAGPTPEVG
jgi:hypothetical protein